MKLLAQLEPLLRDAARPDLQAKNLASVRRWLAKYLAWLEDRGLMRFVFEFEGGASIEAEIACCLEPEEREPVRTLILEALRHATTFARTLVVPSSHVATTSRGPESAPRSRERGDRESCPGPAPPENALADAEPPRKARRQARTTVAVLGDACGFTAADCSRLGARFAAAIEVDAWSDALAVWNEMRERGSFRLLVNGVARRALKRWGRVGERLRRRQVTS